LEAAFYSLFSGGKEGKKKSERLIAKSGFLIPAVRNVEDILPDHDQLATIDQPQIKSEQPSTEVSPQPVD
jgi:hypothetical protein